MLDGDELGRSGKDRILVRPYIKEADPGSASTREIPVAEEPDEPPTTVLPRPYDALDPAADVKDRRMVFWLVAAGLAVVVGAAAVIIALWPSGDDRGGRAGVVPGATLPIGGTGPQASGSAPAGAKAGASGSTGPSASVTLSLQAPPGSGPSSKPPANQPSQAATLAPPPASNRVGAITGPGGHCLDVGGIGLPGSPAITQNCNGTLSQRWTAATDGTLRAGGMCAAADGSSVHLVGCGSDQTGQWRAGPNGTLVNLTGNRCLTDPDNGTKTGGRTQLAACGGAGQRWTLP
jgi:hypothetical protein